MQTCKYITKAFAYKSTRIAVLHVYTKKDGDQYKIMKHVINYVRGQNVESWRVMGSASTFTDLRECIVKFETLVNSHRKATGKEPIKFTVED